MGNTMIRKNPAYDTEHPPGQIRNDVVWPFPSSSFNRSAATDGSGEVRLSDIIKGVVERSSESPVKSNKELFDEGYAAGWLDCQASQRKWQEENKG